MRPVEQYPEYSGLTIVSDESGYEYVRYPPEERMRNAGVPRRFQALSWAELDWSDIEADAMVFTAVSFLRTWARSSEINTVVLQAPPGRGKSTLAACKVRDAVTVHLGAACWLEWPRMLEDVKACWHTRDTTERAILSAATRHELLVVDDFCKELVSNRGEESKQWTRQLAYSLANERYTTGRKTIYTTELSADKLRRQLDEAITGRLIENGIWIDLSALPNRRG
jgi:DNA replication protein DnaC